MNLYKIGNRHSGLLIIIVAVLMGLAYSLLDTYIDEAFRNNNDLREIYEKSTVALLFIVFGIIFYWQISRIRFFQMKLEERERKYREYMSLAPDPIFVADKNGNVKETNPAAEDATEYSSDELCGKNITSILSTESVKDGYGFLLELMEQTRAVTTLCFLKKNSAKIYMNTGAAKIDDNRYLYICRDITDFVDMSNRMKQMNSELQSRVDSELVKLRKQEYVIENSKKFADMGHMLTAISHQWRQPLNSLGLYAQDIVETYRSGELTEEYVEDFDETTKKLIMQMSTIIDDFRVFFSPDGQGKEMHVLHEIMDILNILSAQVYYLGVDMKVRCGCKDREYDCKNVFTCPDCDIRSAFVTGNAGKFRQAILNILYNSLEALQAKKESDISFKGVINVRLRCQTGVIIDVEDNGGGFSEESMSKAFEPYYSTKKEGGTGLGLFTVKMVIEDNMGGRVSLMNIDDGARVHIELAKSGKTLD